MKYTKARRYLNTILVLVITIFSLSLVLLNEDDNLVQTFSANQKVGWGVKQNKNHEQPDVGAENKKVLEENNGICLGSKDSKNIYLTFDEGYEAGYTPQILETLKENNVKATFFVTAHYVNSQPDLIKQMIDEGHIVGNHTPKFLMSRNNINVKC